MKLKFIIAAGAVTFGLAACGGPSDDEARADMVAACEAYDNSAEACGCVADKLADASFTADQFADAAEDFAIGAEAGEAITGDADAASAYYAALGACDVDG